MADSVAKGEELFRAAQKKLKSFSFFGEPESLISTEHCMQYRSPGPSVALVFMQTHTEQHILHLWCAGNKNEEAAELLEKAANYYKLGKAWREATEAYRQLAAIQIKQDSKHDAANAYVEGAKCAMKVQPKEAVVLLQSAVELYTDMGRLNMAARQLRDIAEAQEKQGLKEEALQFYAQAADLFATENATSDSNKARIKVAELSAEMDRYQVSQKAALCDTPCVEAVLVCGGLTWAQQQACCRGKQQAVSATVWQLSWAACMALFVSDSSRSLSGGIAAAEHLHSYCCCHSQQSLAMPA